MIDEIYNTIASSVLVIGGIGVVIGIAKGVCNTVSRHKSLPKREKYTVEVEISDPMVVSEIQVLKQLQEVYNAQISQQQDKYNIICGKYDSITEQIEDQYKQMEYATNIGEIKISENLYKSRIAELSESKNNLMGQILRIEEKILKLTEQSDSVTAKLVSIGMREYKRQNL
jgi:hypothetical protein